MTALLLAAILARPVALVDTVYWAARRAGIDPVLAVAVVEYESWFDPSKDVACGDTTDWGLFQLNSRYHVQHRESIDKHIAYGVAYLAECLAREKGSRTAGLSRYNAGAAASVAGRLYAARVLAIWRRLMIAAGKGKA